MSGTSSSPMAAVNWFEIPAADLDRAQAFYENVLGRAMVPQDMGGMRMTVFAYRQPGAGGCLVGEGFEPKPSQAGTVVYLDASPSLDAALERVVAAGGKIVRARTELPDGVGAFALILDTEGNRVGLHALS